MSVLSKKPDIIAWNDDALNLLKSFPANKFQYICIDPPYEITDLPWDSWEFKSWMPLFKRILGSGYLSCFGSFELLAYIYHYVSQAKLFHSRFQTIWIKDRAPRIFPNMKLAGYQHELIAHMIPTDIKLADVTFNQVKKINPRGSDNRRYGKGHGVGSEYENLRGYTYLKSHYYENKGLRNETTVVYYPLLERELFYGRGKQTMPVNERTPHPTQKPEPLIRYLVETFTNPGDWVLDCFGGSGTTAVVCKKLNRNCVTIEKDPEYFNNILVPRIEKTAVEAPKSEDTLFNLFGIEKAQAPEG